MDVGSPTEDLHLMSSCPCWAYTKACSGTERFTRVVYQRATPSAEACAVMPLRPWWGRNRKMICESSRFKPVEIFDKKGFCVDSRAIAPEKYWKRSPLLNFVLCYGSTATSATGIGRKYDFLVSPPSFLDCPNHSASSLLAFLVASITSRVKNCELGLSAFSSNNEIIW